MSPAQAVAKCLRSYGTFTGRASQSEFWWFYPVVVTAVCAADEFGTKLAGVTVAALLVLPTLAVTVRRLHDVGDAGSYAFIGLVPIVGQL